MMKMDIQMKFRWFDELRLDSGYDTDARPRGNRARGAVVPRLLSTAGAFLQSPFFRTVLYLTLVFHPTLPELLPSTRL